MQQRSPEWFEARRGKATGSRFSDVMARLKGGGEGATRKNYRVQLVVERLTEQVMDSFTNTAMQWGIDTEPVAKTAYMLQTGNMVEDVAFVKHPTLEAGVSPDGYVGTLGLLEIKCPNTATHIDYLHADGAPSDYKAQIQGQLWVTERQWCDFVSFDPRMPDGTQLLIVRVERDESYIEMLEAEVKQFLEEVDQEVQYLKNYNKKGGSDEVGKLAKKTTT